MKRHKITVKTKEGDVELQAYMLVPGLYVHRSFGFDESHKRSTKHFTEDNYWTIYHESGYEVCSLSSWPVKLKTILQSGKSLVEYLDWTKPYSFFEQGSTPETELYRNAVWKLKSRVELLSGR